MARRYANWTRDELILALDLYFRCPPLHISKSHPEVIALSQLLNALPLHHTYSKTVGFRYPNSVYMKLCNFLRLDPSYKGKGLEAGAKADEVVWNEFAHDQPRLHALAMAIKAHVAPGVGEATEKTIADVDDGAPEGVILLREHKLRERNVTLIRKKKAEALQRLGILACEVCGFNFAQAYGSRGDGFIECHHIVPLSHLRPGQVTSQQDLALVCANCHRMLHHGGELLTVSALRQLVRDQLASIGKSKIGREQ
jgi:5-methylcytosine-specific restriction enzyme A